tara:strand:- start:1806 stop:1994 length:189 start_codon:yes stop_codon:yes gene_type:complete
MYEIKKEQDKYVICKNGKPLLLPCKMIKKKKVVFDNIEEAKKYIRNVKQLMQNGEEYLETYK